MVTINKSLQLSAAEAKKVSYGSGNSKRYLCIHTTGNTSHGANALAHARLQKNGNSRQASWHYTVDDDGAYKSLDHGIRAWHAGSGNYNSIAIETCVNSDGNWDKTMHNLIELSAKIMKEEGIQLVNVKQHNFFTGKNCPTQIRAGKGGWTWSKFLTELGKAVNQKTDTDKTSTTGTDEKGKLIVDGYWGRDTTKAMQEILGTYVDGFVSGQVKNGTAEKIIGVQFGSGGSPMIKALQKKLGVNTDGYIGSATVKALQKKLGTYVDGKISSPSSMVKALQRKLNTGKLF